MKALKVIGYTVVAALVVAVLIFQVISSAEPATEMCVDHRTATVQVTVVYAGECPAGGLR